MAAALVVGSVLGGCGSSTPTSSTSEKAVTHVPTLAECVDAWNRAPEEAVPGSKRMLAVARQLASTPGLTGAAQVIVVAFPNGRCGVASAMPSTELPLAWVQGQRSFVNYVNFAQCGEVVSSLKEQGEAIVAEIPSRGNAVALRNGDLEATGSSIVQLREEPPSCNGREPGESSRATEAPEAGSAGVESSTQREALSTPTQGKFVSCEHASLHGSSERFPTGAALIIKIQASGVGCPSAVRAAEEYGNVHNSARPNPAGYSCEQGRYETDTNGPGYEGTYPVTCNGPGNQIAFQVIVVRHF